MVERAVALRRVKTLKKVMGEFRSKPKEARKEVMRYTLCSVFRTKSLLKNALERLQDYRVWKQK